MAIKTISLELDAYEKLRQAKRGNESFSSVVRRASFSGEDSTGENILNEMKALYRVKRGITKKNLDYWDRVTDKERDTPGISSSHWNSDDS